MTSATSFSNRYGGRPPHYRTPSPPRRAVEPISPPYHHHPPEDFNSHRLFDHVAPRPFSPDRQLYPLHNTSRHSLVERGNRHKSAHGRSDSTIDALATIALATSPTFSQQPYKPSFPSSASAMPLFPVDTPEFVEPPAKRPRSEKDSSSSFRHQLSGGFGGFGAGPSSIPDSMKIDAELLLNLARPSVPPTPNHQKRVSISESYQYGSDTKRQSRVGFANGGRGGSDDRRPSNSDYAENNGLASSRTRSKSDGSTFLSRPFIQGLRPNTSSSAQPPAWQEEHMENGWSRAPPKLDEAAQSNEPNPDFGEESSLHPVPKAEENTEDFGDSSQEASCTACKLVRIPMDTGDQDEEEVTWINCDGCKRWFHIVCAGFKDDREVRTVDKFICRGCRPIHGPTTFVRKSSRARTAIDYAGLNQGLVKSAADTLEHHYIEPIKQGKIQFQPENFARLSPELLTTEFFEPGNGMLEPVVVPACLNTRQSVPAANSGYDEIVQEAPTEDMFDELLDHLPSEQQGYEETVDCGQDLLDMVIPQGLTVRDVAALYGPDERVEVIDVKSQQGEDKRWNMQRWADYYESTGPKIVRNVISLEVSQSKLGRLIRRPKVVRDLDLQDSVWPEELKAIGDYPKVQFYCLMSVADCYTDFHIDFGGSWVYYHILKGTKTFFFIPPKDKHLKKYEDWCNSPAQDTTFLGDQTKECYRVDLSEGDTMLIPSGWIHAVWTPANSLVIGGNFLTRLSYEMQIKIAKIEKDTKVPRKFRYPFFQKVQWFTALKYLEEDPIPQSVLDAFAQDENYTFKRQYPIYYEFGERTNTAPPGSPYYNSRRYSKAEMNGFHSLAKYLLRTALIAGSYLVDGVTVDTRNAIRRSIPKGIGDPVDVIRKFGVWIAWKIGNEPAPQWTRPGVIESNPKIGLTEKRPAGRPSRRLERHVDSQKLQAERLAVQKASEEPSDLSSKYAPNGDPPSIPVSSDSTKTNNVPERATSPSAAAAVVVTDENSKPRTTQRGSGLGPKRVACDACRKRRIRCRHKDEQNDMSPTKRASTNALGVGVPQQSSSLAHDAAPALSSLAAVASETGLQNTDGMAGVDHSGNPSGNFNSTYTGTTPNANKMDDAGSGINFGKKGRSKACDDCRKSKRRCIHDEHGNIDPEKAQERSKPRVTSASKRSRPADWDAMATSNKRTKQESTSPVARMNRASSTVQADATTAPPSNPNQASEQQDPTGPVHREASPIPSTTAEAKNNNKTPLSQTSYASPPLFQTDALVTNANEVEPASVPAQPATSLVSPPTSQADEADVDVAQRQGDGAGAGAGAGAGGDMTTSAENENVPTTVPTPAPAPQTPALSSRHSSRQPRQVDRYVPGVGTQTQTYTQPPPQPPRIRRHSTHSQNQHYTLDASKEKETASTQTQKKPNTPTSSHPHPHPHPHPQPNPTNTNTKPPSRPSSSRSKKSNSPTLTLDGRLDHHHQIAASSSSSSLSPTQLSKSAKRERERPGLAAAAAAAAAAENEPDAESLRLIRELQEQDFGLRKRTARV